MNRLIWFLFVVDIFSVAQVGESGSQPSRVLRLYVVDGNGHPVTGLGREMFSLYEGVSANQYKRSRNISHFDELAFSMAPNGSMIALPQAPTPRTIIIVLDSNNLTRQSFDSFVRTIDYYIDHLKRKEDVVKIVHMDDGMRHLTPFTSLSSELHKGLASARYRGRLLRDLKIHERRILRKVLASLETPRLKVFERNEVNFLVESKEIRKKDFLHAFYINMLSLNRILSPLKGSKTIFWLTGGAYVEYDGRISNTNEMMVRLSETFNSGNITVHSLLDKSSFFPFRSLATSNRLERVWTPEITASRLSSSDHFPPDSKVKGSSNTVLENKLQLTTGPREMTARTGGFFTSSRSKNLNGAFSKLVFRSSHYYRLGYLVDKNGGPKVTVSLSEEPATRGYRLFYGSDYEQPIPYLEMSQERRSLEFEYLLCFSRGFRNDFEAHWGFDLFLGEDGTNRIPVHMHIPPEHLSGAKLEVGYALLDADYRVVDITDSVVTGYQQNLSQLLYDVLISEEVPAFVRFYLRDLESGKLSVHELVVGDAGNKAADAHLSQVLLSTVEPVQMLVLPSLRPEKAGKARLRRAEDPLSLGGSHFTPRVGSRFAAPEMITFYFHLYNAPKKQDNYSFSLKVKRADGQPLLIGSTLNQVHSVSRRTYHYFGTVDTRSLASGAYDLLVEITDRQTGNRYQRTRRFDIVTEGISETRD